MFTIENMGNIETSRIKFKAKLHCYIVFIKEYVTTNIIRYNYNAPTKI